MSTEMEKALSRFAKTLAKVREKAGRGGDEVIDLDHYSPGGNPFTWALIERDRNRGGESIITGRRYRKSEMLAALVLATEALERFVLEPEDWA